MIPLCVSTHLYITGLIALSTVVAAKRDPGTEFICLKMADDVCRSPRAWISAGSPELSRQA